MYTVNPDPARLKQTFAAIPADKPIVMLNLLKFRERAEYDDIAMNCSGREAYFERYSVEAYKFVKSVGGGLLWSGAACGSVIAPADESWDEVLLVRYPSIAAFQTMLYNPDYQKCAIHRTAALENSRLIATLENT